ncbi:hypothetical protein CN97_00650 [Haematobacter massiliensis]|uniref:Uncharacterized protein n=1 Tax=Haematobacter massiliensis TaxID=195105 RepID=A0A086Y0H4_9RHOB|nr:hypothetical protein [Haematobacter massiliensis]KFI27774.1 hypothetical protein CN97_00650 [Haematobacter massiliensis]OWJ83102.1 hypothetical protein CDV51_16270 [Haematobacter massiliensis]
MTAVTMEEPTRRALLNMAIAAPVAGAIWKGVFAPEPGEAAPSMMGQDDTPVMQWFRRWQEATTALSTRDMTDEEFQMANEDRIAIEDSLMAIPAENARDFVAKVYAYTNRGEVGLPNHNEARELWAEARAIIG